MGMTSRLPDERPARATKRDIAVIALTLTAFFILANVIISVAFDQFHTQGNETYTVYCGKWDRLLSLDEPVDTVILGDSSGLHGVQPCALDQTIGGRSINLCTWGDALLLNDAWMLQVYLEKFAPPKRVVLVHVYDVWRREINLPLLAKTPLPWGFWDEMRPPVQLSTGEAFQSFLLRYVPLVSQDKTMRKVVTDFENIDTLGDYVDSSGFYGLAEADPQEVVEDCMAGLAVAQRENFSVSDINRDAMDAIAQLAERYRFHVYMVNAPIYEGVFKEPSFREDYNQVQDYITQYTQAHPYLHQVFKLPMTFGVHEMENVDHLIASEAVDFSRSLGNEIHQMENKCARIHLKSESSRLWPQGDAHRFVPRSQWAQKQFGECGATFLLHMSPGFGL